MSRFSQWYTSALRRDAQRQHIKRTLKNQRAKVAEDKRLLAEKRAKLWDDIHKDLASIGRNTDVPPWEKAE